MRQRIRKLVLSLSVPKTLILIGAVFIILLLTSFTTRGESVVVDEATDSESVPAPVQVQASTPAPVVPVVLEEKVDPDTVLSEYMHMCEERIDVVEYDDNGKQIPRKRIRFSTNDQRRMMKDIHTIAKEMGMDVRLLWIWGLRESSYRPHKRHALQQDQVAARQAWARYRYTPEREAKMKHIMATSSAMDGTRKYWRAKAILEKMEVYRNNPTYKAQWRWKTGLGLYGMQPVYHLLRWDNDAPPEVLCDPVIVTITAVWAARDARNACLATGFGDSNVEINRSYSAGHCRPRPKREYLFRNRANKRKLDPDATVRLGTKWPKKTTDRDEILAHMKRKIALSRATTSKGTDLASYAP